MAKKTFRFDQLSSITCSHPGCPKKIKMNLVVRKSSANLLCFRHYNEKKTAQKKEKRGW